MRFPGWKARIRALLSPALAVVILMVGARSIADLDDAWSRLGDIDTAETVALAAATLLNLASYWLLLIVAMPGLSLGQAAASSQASTAAANALPGGAAVGATLTWTMYRSYGFSPSQISSAMSLTGFWNTAVKLATPAMALAALAAGGDAPPVGVALASALALGALAVSAWWLLNSSAALRGFVKVGSWIARKRGRVSGELAERVQRARSDFASRLRQRWLALSLTATASHAALFVLLVVCARTVGVSAVEVSLGELVTVFALVRIALIIPLTPGGAGVAEVGYASLLGAFGADPAAGVAAVVLFRSLTWLLPIPTGAVAYLAWARFSHRASAGAAS